MQKVFSTVEHARYFVSLYGFYKILWQDGLWKKYIYFNIILYAVILMHYNIR